MINGFSQYTLFDRKPDLDLFALQHHRCVLRDGAGSWLRFRRDELLRIGLRGCTEHRSGIAVFDNTSCLHDIDPLRCFSHHVQIMGNEQYAHPGVFSQFGNQFQNLGLGSHVYCRRWLVGNEQIGFIGKRHGDHDPLALSTGKLVWIRSQP